LLDEPVLQLEVLWDWTIFVNNHGFFLISFRLID